MGGGDAGGVGRSRYFDWTHKGQMTTRGAISCCLKALNNVILRNPYTTLQFKKSNIWSFYSFQKHFMDVWQTFYLHMVLRRFTPVLQSVSAWC